MCGLDKCIKLLPSNKVISRVSYPHGLLFRPNNSRYFFLSLTINKRVKGLEICNFYMFATYQVTCFWLQQSKQRLGFFESHLFILLDIK